MEALRQQATKAAAAYRDWAALHEQCTAHLSTAVNILARLQPLQDAAHAEVLALDGPTAAAVLSKQLAALQAALAGARGALPRLAACVRDLERASLEAGRLAGGRPLAAAAARRGPEPAAAEVAEALQDAWRMCRDELALKQAAVGILRMDTPPDEAAALLACFDAQPNIDAQRLEAFWQQVVETAPRRAAA